jgi:hypothetical protein
LILSHSPFNNIIHYLPFLILSTSATFNNYVCFKRRDLLSYSTFRVIKCVNSVPPPEWGSDRPRLPWSQCPATRFTRFRRISAGKFVFAAHEVYHVCIITFVHQKRAFSNTLCVSECGGKVMWSSDSIGYETTLWDVTESGDHMSWNKRQMLSRVCGPECCSRFYWQIVLWSAV